MCTPLVSETLPSGPSEPCVVAKDCCWSIWRAGDDLVGVLVRGTVEASDAERMASALDESLARARTPVRLIIDALDLEDAGCGVVAAEILWHASRELSRRYRFARVGMAHKVGASGALVAGWARLLGGSWPSLVSPDMDDVLGFLAVTHLAAHCDALREAGRGALEARLARAFKERPRARLAELAEAVGVDLRHLRDHFSSRGTSFRDESLRRRLDIAREALARPGAKLDSVGLEAGFNSGSHLATAMRRHCPGFRRSPTSPGPLAPPGSGHTVTGPERPRLVELEDFVRSPIGCSYVSRSWLIWFADPSLALCSVFGPMSGQDLLDLFTAIDAVMNAASGPIDVLSDATLGQIKDVGPEGMALLYRYTSEHKERLSRTIRHHAITATDTPGGAFLGGLGEVNEARHPWRVIGSVEDALRWFGREDGPVVSRMLSELIQTARDGGALLREIETRLRQTPGQTIAEVARSLGMSVRALQRDCSAQGTSFRELQRRVLLERARELLVTTDLKIEAIARQLGLRSRSHFVSLFSEATGTSPSQFRESSKVTRRAE